jgi:hypothetical protein
MPTPPRKNEKKKDFISRAIKFFIEEGKSKEQAAAIAYSMWKRKSSLNAQFIQAEKNHDFFRSDQILKIMAQNLKKKTDPNAIIESTPETLFREEEKPLPDSAKTFNAPYTPQTLEDVNKLTFYNPQKEVENIAKDYDKNYNEATSIARMIDKLKELSFTLTDEKQRTINSQKIEQLTNRYNQLNDSLYKQYEQITRKKYEADKWWNERQPYKNIENDEAYKHAVESIEYLVSIPARMEEYIRNPKLGLEYATQYLQRAQTMLNNLQMIQNQSWSPLFFQHARNKVLPQLYESLSAIQAEINQTDQMINNLKATQNQAQLKIYTDYKAKQMIKLNLTQGIIKILNGEKYDLQNAMANASTMTYSENRSFYQ